MKRTIVTLLMSMTMLAACASTPETPTPTLEPSPVALPASAASPTQAPPEGKLPAAPFDAETYINRAAGFALDYPAGWTVVEEVIGPRGTQVQFLSSPGLAAAESLPAGETRVSAVIYEWDPKNDLAAFVANQKTAWEASGFSVLEEEALVLELGLSAVRLRVQTPDSETVYLIAALEDRYLVVSGEGDLDLVSEIAGRVRPVAP